MSTVSSRRVSTVPDRRATFLDVVRSEWTKLRSLRSTWWTLLAAFVVTVGLSLLIDWAIVSSWDQSSAEDKATFDATSNSLNGLVLGQLATAVLGVMAVSSEYSTGGIRATFIAVPRRLSVLGAKALVIAALGLVIGMLTSFTAFLAGQAIFAAEDIDTSLGEPGVLRAVTGAGLYIASCGLFGLAVGSVLRGTPAAISGVVALLFVLPLLALAIPGDIGETISDWFTSNAGSLITYAQPPADSIGAWAGFGGFTLEWLLLLVLGAVLVRQRDA